MIDDTQARNTLEQEWRAVRRFQGMLQVNFRAAIHARGAWFLELRTNDVYAILLPFGFSVLEHALQQMHDEGKFKCKSSQLRLLMESSKTVIAWSDYDEIDSGRELRNALTHEQKIPPYTETFKALDKIEQELIGWGILNGPIKIVYTISG